MFQAIATEPEKKCAVFNKGSWSVVGSNAYSTQSRTKHEVPLHYFSSLAQILNPDEEPPERIERFTHYKIQNYVYNGSVVSFDVVHSIPHYETDEICETFLIKPKLSIDESKKGNAALKVVFELNEDKRLLSTIQEETDQQDQQMEGNSDEYDLSHLSNESDESDDPDKLDDTHNLVESRDEQSSKNTSCGCIGSFFLITSVLFGISNIIFIYSGKGMEHFLF